MTAAKRELRLYPEDILDCVDELQAYTAGVSEEAFVGNTQLQDAILRRLEIIGEEVKHIPKRLRDRYPTIP